MEALLQAGADVSSRAASKTPLHVALYDGNVQAIKLLLDYGADPSAIARVVCYATPDESSHCTEQDVLPMDFAAQHGHHHAISYMLSRFTLTDCGGELHGYNTFLVAACR